MKVTQEFYVAHDAGKVWAILERTDRIAACVPGVEEVEEIGADEYRVKVTQKVGPISATFKAKVTIAEKIDRESMRIVSTGQVARGAAGSFRSDVLLRLIPEGEGTRVRVEGEVALAGMLGSVGQSVVERQMSTLAATFAQNLSKELDPKSPASPAAPAIAAAVSAQPTTRKMAESGFVLRDDADLASLRVASEQALLWSKFAAGLSAATLAVALVLLGRLLA